MHLGPALLLCSLLASVPQAAAKTVGFDLLTPGEVALRRDRAPARDLIALQNDGPEIRSYAPQGFGRASPVYFDVEILLRNGVAVDLASIKIAYRFGPIWTDVTGQLRNNAQMNGLCLLVLGAKLRSGRHTLCLTITDRDGRITEARLSFTVET